MKYKIDPDLCRRCSICKKQCPVEAITGDKKNGFVINQDICIKCGQCQSKCPFNAILHRDRKGV